MAVEVTLEKAFNYLYEIGGEEAADVNIERAIRAIGYLLQWSTEIGNEHMDGCAASGLAVLLQQAASRMAESRERRRRHE